MARAKVKLNHAGIAALLEDGGMRGLVAEAASAIAANCEGAGIMVEGVPGRISLPVEVSITETDRAHGTVTLAHPSGQAVQAKHGLLTQAAAAAGLEVHGE